MNERKYHYLSHIFAFVLLCNEVQASLHICSGVEEEVLKDKLGTKTGYANAFKDTSWSEHYNKTVKECSPKKLWFLTRHGTRYPIKKDMEMFVMLPRLTEEVVYNHLQGRGCLSEEDVFELKRWYPPYSTRDRGELQETGYEELFNMGEKWRQMFPELFGDKYCRERIKVEFTVQNRTGQSAYHFLRGLYGDEAIATIKLPKPYSPNFLLRFYKSCPRWLRDVYEQNETTYKEQLLFEQSYDYQGVLHAVSARLGYMYPLKKEELIVMYDECRYEVAWFPRRTSVWCKAFSKRDLEIMEYHQDLKYYYEDSHGTPFNKEIACKTVSDLYSHMRGAITTDEPLPMSVLYFAHDKTIMKVHAALKLFEPTEHLKHSNFYRMENRAFRSSITSPFASNIGFVLFKCSSDHRIVWFLHGEPYHNKVLCRDLFCKWSELKNYLDDIYKACDLAKSCMIHDEL